MKLFARLLRNHNKYKFLSLASVAGIGSLSYILYKKHDMESQKFISAYSLSVAEKADFVPPKRRSREERFLDFASFECNGVAYMTPSDFLESATQNRPKLVRKNRQTISVKDAKRMTKSTPSKKYGSKGLFRTINEEGLITYTEYLFLLGVLTKPHSGFKIAFNMFDIDMNEEIDKREFLVMERTMQDINAEIARNHKISMESKKEETSWFLFKLLNRAVIAIQPYFNTNESEENEVNDKIMSSSSNETEDSRFPQVIEMEFDTSILIHFFGKSGKEKLRFVDFARFMENLQTEVLEIEFSEFSKGLKTISEIDFAKILLRYTTVDDKRHDIYCKRVADKISWGKGITFDDFKAFFQFLNCLEDFIIAMKMYTMVDQPISQQEFHQAVKACTHTTLSTQLVETIFAMFDEDNDGFLSYNEFIKSMKNRMSRGFNSSSTKVSMGKRLKRCVSNELNKTY